MSLLRSGTQLEANLTDKDRTVLVTGATGYIGGRLAPQLLEAGYTNVRVLARDVTRLQGRLWVDRVDAVQGDVLKPETLPPVMRGVDAAYYFIHSLQAGSQYSERDVTAATNFSQAARAAGVKRIIYLSGLGDPSTSLSEHLRSRQETGKSLRSTGVPVTEFRSAVIVGPGSASFEIIRYVTERIPFLPSPRWASTRIQPIAITDVLGYLVAALETPESVGKVIEIGGADVLTYGDLLLGYARARGLRRRIVRIPFITPGMVGFVIHLLTPIPRWIAQPLLHGMKNEVIVRDDLARRLFPGLEPMNYGAALAHSLSCLVTGDIETAWCDALFTSQGDDAPEGTTNEEGIITDVRQRVVSAPPAAVYRSFTRLGGTRGWLAFDWAWRVRGMVDRLIGGVGLQRGRRHPDELRPGDALDFWRVEIAEPDKLLELRAEMKVPGSAWLRLEARPLPDGSTQMTQRAIFIPRGLAGHLYWYGLWGFHWFIFELMADRLAASAEQMDTWEESGVA